MTQVNFRIDDEVKENAESALKDMGLTMSAAITMFLTKVGRERRIPFEITADADPFYSPANIERLKKSIAQMETVGGTIHEVSYDE
ncbi:MAG: type II toxin-antitoxin system RelB/DinJ family antitoxin [Lachnospiraceae bacterium]|nr:type II toxin-antitoxin system RelB/DinJ family antitoxin [Lachnospiraceae bacterium]